MPGKPPSRGVDPLVPKNFGWFCAMAVLFVLMAFCAFLIDRRANETLRTVRQCVSLLEHTAAAKPR